MDHEHFDNLRKQALEIQASTLTRALFLDVINSMEKIHNKITQVKVDLKCHDEHGRVVDAKGFCMPDKGC